MAFFVATTAVNTTGKGSGQPFPEGPWVGGESEILVTAAEREIIYYGSFVYDDGSGDLVGGTLLEIEAVLSATGLTEAFNLPVATWRADPDETFSVLPLFDASTDAAFYGILFRGDDSIGGSDFNDKLAGYKGNDYVAGNKGKDKLYGDKGADTLDGGKGNDKSWGGSGIDWFYFAKGYDKDIVKDFDRKKDILYIDDDLARNYFQIKEAASQKKGKLVLDFGKGDKFIIKDVKLKHLEKITFDFEIDA
ncbi:MAG: calcium-binding protein [Hyphomicrobiales bacterium]|nr:calcium-binding protein [Hyphomicrobiales bacterium]